MAYSKQSWADGSSGGTPLSAARLQHMEDGIAAAVTVDAYGDPSGEPNGAPTALTSGQPVTVFGNAPITVSSGQYVHTPSAGPNSAGYIQANAGARVTRIGGEVVFPTGATGSIALVVPSSEWRAGGTGPLTAAGVHFVLLASGSWHISNWTGAAEEFYAEGVVGSLADGLPRRVEITIDPDRSIARLLLPDGSVREISDSRIATNTSTWAVWELFEANGTGAVPARFDAVWADTSPAPAPRGATVDDVLRVAAAGVQRAGLMSDWEPKTPYAAGELVTRLGRLYRAKASHTSAGSWDAALYDDLGVYQSPVQNIQLTGNYDGGDTYNTTPVLRLTSHQRPISPNYGEVIRLDMMRPNAKAMLAWRLPYDPELPESDSNPMRTVAWTGAHYHAQDTGEPIHGHWAVEVPDAAGILRTRFEIPFVDKFGGIDTVVGVDVTDILTSRANFTVNSSAGGNLRVESTSGTNRQIVFATQFGGAEPALDGNTRWKMGPLDSEFAGTIGSNWQLDHYDDTGTILGTAIFSRRSTGHVTFGAATYEGSSRVTAMWNGNAGAGSHGFLSKPSALNGAYSNFAANTPSATDRILNVIVGAETTARLTMYADRIEWGPGNAGRDVTLSRSAAGVLSLNATAVLKTGHAVTASRPAAATVGKGAQFFDDTLNRPIWSDGTNWLDAAGATV